MVPKDFTTWDPPSVTLFVTGQQNGYIEPCGCTGLDKQKGGVARRKTLMAQLQQMGWDLLPIDAGNQIRRRGQQAAIKFAWSSEALNKMKYQMVGFGPDDMRLGGLDLLQIAMADDPQEAMYISANVTLIDPSAMPSFKVVTRGKQKVGMTSVLDPKALTNTLSEDVIVDDPKKGASEALVKMNEEGANFRVLAFYGTDSSSEEAAIKLVKDVPGYDLVIVGGGYGEPTYKPQSIPDSKTKLIVTGNKAMYVGLVGLYDDQPMKYARVPLSHEYSDDKEMRQLMADYQQQLEQLGLDGLGLRPIPHADGKFAGSAKCKSCHEFAYEIWEASNHFLATKACC